MKTYKLRTECLNDVINILNELHSTQDAINTKIIPCYLEGTLAIPDCILELDSPLSLSSLKKRILKAERPEDGVELHVAVETVQPIEKYTGERG